MKLLELVPQPSAPPTNKGNYFLFSVSNWFHNFSVTSCLTKWDQDPSSDPVRGRNHEMRDQRAFTIFSAVGTP